MDENQNLTVAGLPWLEKGEHRKINPANLVGNVLCERHNNALSPIDSVGINFFRTLRQVEQEFQDLKESQKQTICLYNGHDIERWMLKFLCGLIFSKNGATLNDRILGWIPSVIWLNMLFGTQRFHRGCGLYYLPVEDEKYSSYEGVDLEPIMDYQNNIYGAFIKIKLNTFVLAVNPIPESIENTFLKNGIYRPHQMTFKQQNNPTVKAVVFGWDSQYSPLNITRTYPALL